MTLILKSFLFIFILIVVLISNCQAASITYDKDPKSGEGRIFIKGEIADGDAVEFKKIIAHFDRATVFLDSPGGSVGPAIQIGRLIYALGYMTAVNDAVCASACSDIWLAGSFKFLTPDAKVGFHLPAIYETDKKTESNIASTYFLLGAYLSSIGYPEHIIAYLNDTPHDEIKWVTLKSAKSIGLTVFEFFN
jgi:hypothetical protein